VGTGLQKGLTADGSRAPAVRDLPRRRAFVACALGLAATAIGVACKEQDDDSSGARKQEIVTRAGRDPGAPDRSSECQADTLKWSRAPREWIPPGCIATRATLWLGVTVVEAPRMVWLSVCHGGATTFVNAARVPDAESTRRGAQQAIMQQPLVEQVPAGARIDRIWGTGDTWIGIGQRRASEAPVHGKHGQAPSTPFLMTKSLGGAPWTWAAPRGHGWFAGADIIGAASVGPKRVIVTRVNRPPTRAKIGETRTVVVDQDGRLETLRVEHGVRVAAVSTPDGAAVAVQRIDDSSGRVTLVDFIDSAASLRRTVPVQPPGAVLLRAASPVDGRVAVIFMKIGGQHWPMDENRPWVALVDKKRGQVWSGTWNTPPLFIVSDATSDWSGPLAAVGITGQARGVLASLDGRSVKSCFGLGQIDLDSSSVAISNTAIWLSQVVDGRPMWGSIPIL